MNNIAKIKDWRIAPEDIPEPKVDGFNPEGDWLGRLPVNSVFTARRRNVTLRKYPEMVYPFQVAYKHPCTIVLFRLDRGKSIYVDPEIFSQKWVCFELFGENKNELKGNEQ